MCLSMMPLLISDRNFIKQEFNVSQLNTVHVFFNFMLFEQNSHLTSGSPPSLGMMS